MQDLLDRLSAIVDRHNEVGKMITDPDVISDMKRYPTLMKEYKDLGVLVDKYHEYKKVNDDLKAAKDILYSNEDPDLKELAQEEFDTLTPLKEKMDEELRLTQNQRTVKMTQQLQEENNYSKQIKRELEEEKQREKDRKKQKG